jgi:hypothetical protein
MSLYCPWCRWLYAVIAFHSLQVWHQSEARSITINQHGVLLFSCLALSSPNCTALYTRKKALVSQTRWWLRKTSRERGKRDEISSNLQRLVYLYVIFACHLRVTVERIDELPCLRTLKLMLLSRSCLNILYPFYLFAFRQNLEMIVSKLAKEKPGNGNIILVSLKSKYYWWHQFMSRSNGDSLKP